MRFDEFCNGVGVSQHCNRLFQRLEVLGADQNRSGRAILGHHDTFVV